AGTSAGWGAGQGSGSSGMWAVPTGRRGCWGYQTDKRNRRGVPDSPTGWEMSRGGEQVVPAGGVEDPLGHPLQPGRVGDALQRRLGPLWDRTESLATHDQQDPLCLLGAPLGHALGHALFEDRLV